NYSKGEEDILEKIYDDNGKLGNLQVSVNSLNTTSSTRVAVIEGDSCPEPSDGDCKPCPDGPSDCDNPHCDHPIECDNECADGNGGKDCGCTQGPNIFLPKKRDVEVDCEECETPCEDCPETCITYTEEVKIPQCNCQCYPKPELIKDIKTQLDIIEEAISDKIKRLDDQAKELRERANASQGAKDKINEIESLQNNVVSGYDVVGKVDFSQVKYSTTEAKCYVEPNWQVRKNGTCANAAESTALYTGQIAASMTCCAFVQPCCKLVEYASRFFPIIYQVEGTYNISEKIVDDENRLMLHNLFAPENDLYGYNTTSKLFTHVAPEFIIYKDYPITASTLTGGRVLIYIDMENTNNAVNGGPAKKITDSFIDPSCAGTSC
ncbi:MAG: hypothetical protein NTX52_05120, partial [Planctomycetota bacterium]|nr:hypothetical protein [Planctomycetota bacterium]